MPRTAIQNSGPFCRAEPGKPCKNVGGGEKCELLGFHRHRYPTKTLPAHEIQAASDRAARIKKIGSRSLRMAEVAHLAAATDRKVRFSGYYKCSLCSAEFRPNPKNPGDLSKTFPAYVRLSHPATKRTPRTQIRSSPARIAKEDTENRYSRSTEAV